jgi:Tol biopolymer transport system component
MKRSLVIFVFLFFCGCSKSGNPVKDKNGDGNTHNPPARNPYLLFTLKEGSIFNLYAYDFDSMRTLRLTNSLNVGDFVYSPDKSKIAFSGNYDIYLMEVSTGLTTQITQTSAEESSPVFVGSSDTIAYISREGTNTYSIRFTSAITGVTRVVKSGGDVIRKLSISPRSRYLAYLGPVFPGTMHIISIEDDVEVYIPGLPVDANDYEWAGDDSVLVLATHSGLFYVNVAQRNYRAIVSGDGSYYPVSISGDGKLLAFNNNGNLSLYNIEAGGSPSVIIDPAPGVSYRDIAFDPAQYRMAVIEYQSPEYILSLVYTRGTKTELLRSNSQINRLAW